MVCRRCRQPIEHCSTRGICAWPDGCKGYRHSADGSHCCWDGQARRLFTAEPEPGQLPAVEAPASKPEREVA